MTRDVTCFTFYINIKRKWLIFYSCRCWLCFLLQVSRGSHGESPDISHSSLRPCCADKHIDREPEEQKTSVTLVHTTVRYNQSSSLSSSLNSSNNSGSLVLDIHLRKVISERFWNHSDVQIIWNNDSKRAPQTPDPGTRYSMLVLVHWDLWLKTMWSKLSNQQMCLNQHQNEHLMCLKQECP